MNQQIIDLICKALGVAMEIVIVVLNTLNQLEIKETLTMLGIGLFCIILSPLSNHKEEKKQKFNRKK